MAGREEQKRRDRHIKRAVATAERDLAKKARQAINDLWIDTRFDSQWRNGFEQCKGDALRKLQRVFTESGVEVEKSDVDDERDDPTRDPMNAWAHGVSDMDFD